MRAKYGLTAENRPTISLDARKVSLALRHLIPLAECFGVSDDLIREDLLAETPAQDSKAMREDVAKHADDFEARLAGAEIQVSLLSGVPCVDLFADGV
jgi:hypothetical protein